MSNANLPLSTASGTSTHLPSDRWQYPNVMTQDYHSYWPIGQFMPPYCPPGMAVMPPPPSPMPIPMPVYYQQHGNILPSYENNTHVRYVQNSTPNIRTNEPNNMTIQIGLQCVNQTNPLNINSPNEISMPMFRNTARETNSIAFSQAPPTNGFGNVKNYPSTDTANYNQLNTNKLNCDKKYGLDTFKVSSYINKEMNSLSPRDEIFKMSEYDTPDVPVVQCNHLNHDQFRELTRMVMRGCELAERLAHTHRNRPCFKKIDSLCARMKQDLVRPDGVLANINSQGIAWAVKDFIFVFTRIINAWIIIKGYVYNTPDGLSKVKSALSADFNESFIKWQESTMDFVDNIIKSFLSLDQLVQSQRAAFQKLDVNLKNVTPTNRDGSGSEDQTNGDDTKFNFKSFDETYDYLVDIFAQDNSNPKTTDTITTTELAGSSTTATIKTNYFATVVEDSEETQRKAMANGTYFKTGVYNPLQRDPSNQAVIRNSIGKGEPNDKTSNSMITGTLRDPDGNEIKMLPVTVSHGEGDGKKPNGFFKQSTEHHLSELIGNTLLETKNTLDLGITTTFLTAGQKKIIDPDGLPEKMDYLLQKICNLNDAKYFFTIQFTKNYFPDFHNVVPNYIDLRSIILKAQVGGYKNIYDVVHDLRQIVYSAKVYLQKKPQNFLLKSTMAFEKELDNILGEKLFSKCDFSHITGNPEERE